MVTLQSAACREAVRCTCPLNFVGRTGLSFRINFDQQPAMIAESPFVLSVSERTLTFIRGGPLVTSPEGIAASIPSSMAALACLAQPPEANAVLPRVCCRTGETAQALEIQRAPGYHRHALLGGGRSQ